MSRGIGHTLLRVLILALLAVGFFDPALPVGQERREPVLLLDVSRSVGTRIPRVLTPGDYRIERLHIGRRARWAETAGEAPRVDRDGTALTEGLRQARKRFAGHPVLLVSDGRGTDGDPSAEALALRADGGVLYTMLIDPPAIDVAIEQAQARRVGDEVEIEAQVVSNAAARVRMRVANGATTRQLSQAVSLVPDVVQRVVLRFTMDEDGAGDETAYHLLVEPDGTTVNDNPLNDGVRVSVGSELRRGLLVGGQDLPEPPPTPGVDWSREPRLTPDALVGVDLVVIGNARYGSLAGAQDALRAFVSGGGRLLLLGGPFSWGGGGWAGTALERELSPLRVPTPPEDEVQILLALDHSGSTAEGVLAHLKAAAAAAIADLKPGERLGILGFAGTPDAALLGPGFVAASAPDDLDDATARLERALERIEAGGETDLLAALRRSSQLLDSEAPGTRLVVLLSDGDPDHELDPEALEELRTAWQGRGVEFAALLVGDPESARRLQRHLATRPGAVVDLGQRSERFREVLEALLYARRQRQDRLPRPAAIEAAAGGSWPLGLSRELAPESLQPVETQASGQTLLVARFAEAGLAPVPFVAARSIGAGAVFACAWGPALVLDARARQEAWEALGPWLVALARAADRGLAARLADGHLEVRWPEAAGSAQLEVLPAGAAAPLVEGAPGVFRGPVTDAAAPPHSVRDPRQDRTRALRLPQQPPPEHRGAGPDVGRLEHLAALGGGRRVTELGAVAAIRGPRLVSLAPWALLLACILVLVDVLRRPGAARPEV